MSTHVQPGEDMTPLEKIAASRQALRQYLYPQKPAVSSATGKNPANFLRRLLSGLSGQKNNPGTSLASTAVPKGKQAGYGADATLLTDSLPGVFAQRVWRNHPASLLLDVIRPFVRQQARTRPLRLLLGFTVTGAALVWLRPWRWKKPGKYLSSSFRRQLGQWGAVGLAYALARFSIKKKT